MAGSRDVCGSVVRNLNLEKRTRQISSSVIEYAQSIVVQGMRTTKEGRMVCEAEELRSWGKKHFRVR